MCLLIFITTFVHHLLRSIKDALVLYEPGSGAEVISFLKTYMILPASIAAAIFYMRLRKHYDMPRSYYAIVAGYCVFYTFFAFIVFPNVDYLHPDIQLVAQLKLQYPVFRWFIAIWGMWSYALYYVAAELWGTYVLSVLFWQLANDTVHLDEAERFYPLFVTLSNTALFVLNPFIKSVAVFPDNGVFVSNMVIVASSIIMMAIFRYMEKYDPDTSVRLRTQTEPAVPKKKTVLTEDGWLTAGRSEYIWYIALLVFCYAAIITLVETTWKAQVKSFYVSKAEQMVFYADYTLYTGLATILMNTLSKSVIKKFGWTVGAIITPISCGVLGSLFYALMLAQQQVWLPDLLQANIVQIAVWTGAISVMFSRGAKYSFFDPTKEMAFIPLDKKLSTNGKAVADGMAAKLGKSFGGWFISSATMLVGLDLEGLCATLAVLVLALSVFWLFAVLRLGVLYRKQVQLSATQAQDTVMV